MLLENKIARRRLCAVIMEKAIDSTLSAYASCLGETLTISTFDCPNAFSKLPFPLAYEMLEVF